MFAMYSNFKEQGWWASEADYHPSLDPLSSCGSAVAWWSVSEQAVSEAGQRNPDVSGGSGGARRLIGRGRQEAPDVPVRPQDFRPARGLLRSRERMGAVSDGGTGAKGCSDGHHFGDLRIGCPGLPRFPGVDLDAVRALRRKRNGQCHQFLVLDRNRSVGHRGFVKRPESLHCGWGVLVQSLESSQITHAVHGTPPDFEKFYDCNRRSALA